MLVASLFLLALGGFLLHARIHPFTSHRDSLIPLISGIISIFLIPILFLFRRTTAYAYVINGITVIIGTITMAHFSIVHFKGEINIQNIFFNTTFNVILILWVKFFIGKALFDLDLLKCSLDEGQQVNFSRYFRYPNMGWWLVHLIAITIIYILGNIFWK